MNQKYELNKIICEKDSIIENAKIDHSKNIKKNKHNILIEKLKNNNCVYIVEIQENKLIKIGSSKNVYERLKGLNRLFGVNCLFLEIYECDNFREVESNILADSVIKRNLYREKINDHLSQEVVELSEKFNYDQLITIVKEHVNKITFYTPEQILEKQRLENELTKLNIEKQKNDYDFLLSMANNLHYTETIKDILKSNITIDIEGLNINDEEKLILLKTK